MDQGWHCNIHYLQEKRTHCNNVVMLHVNDQLCFPFLGIQIAIRQIVMELSIQLPLKIEERIF
jgi:hypothetical protein